MSGGSAQSREDKRSPAPEKGLGGPRLPRPTALLIVVAWLAVTAFAAWRIQVRGGPIVDAALDVQISPEHRGVAGEPLAVLRIDEGDREALGDLAPEAVLLQAALAIEERMAGERVPLAPPASEITGWLDEHALYLLPVEEHGALAERLTDEAIAASVQGMVSRLSSPLFGVSGEDPRRDPLGFRDLMDRHEARLGHLRPVAGGSQPTSTGDLIAADGTVLIVQLISDRPPHVLLQELETAIGQRPVIVGLVSPQLRDQAVSDGVRAIWLTTFGAALGALALVLSLALRRVVPVLAMLSVVSSAAILMIFAFGGLTIWTVPLVVFLLGFGCDGALRLRPISWQGWASVAVLSTALLPLWLTPYPVWQSWSWKWLVSFAVVTALVRVVMPALHDLVGDDVDFRRNGFRLREMPIVSLVLCVGLCAGGAYAAGHLEPSRASLPERAPDPQVALEQIVRDRFFDPQLVAESRAFGETPVAALEAAADHVEGMTALVPDDATRIDSPGSFIMDRGLLEKRRVSLAELGLRGRMQELHDALESQGLRPDAFAEFLRGAAEIDDLPDATRAIDGPLASWIRRYQVGGSGDASDGGHGVRTRLHLEDDIRRPPPLAYSGTVVGSGEEAFHPAIELRGPVIADRIEAEAFPNRLGMTLALGLWLGAFWVWLGTRQLSTAIASAVASLASQCAVLVFAWATGGPSFGPHLLAAMLLVGAAATVAAGRACQSVERKRPLVAGGILLLTICEVSGGLVLLGTSEPLWRSTGLIVALGCAVAGGIGLFAAPGLALALRRLTPKGREDKEPSPARGTQEATDTDTDTDTDTNTDPQEPR